MNNFEKPNRIEELEKKLYSRSDAIHSKERRPLRPKEYDVPENWQQDEVPSPQEETSQLYAEKTPNWFFRLFLGALFFFILSASYVGIRFYLNSGIKAFDTEILVNAPLTIGAGETLNFEVLVQNKNQVPIKFVKTEILFPDGTRSVEDITQEYALVTEDIELMGVGESIKKNYSALLFGEEAEKKEISIFVSYQVDGSTKLFKKEKKIDVVLSSTPIRLTVTNIKEITSGQDMIFTIELVSNSTQDLKDVLVEASYPFGFTFASSTIKPQEDKKTWVIEHLKPKETVTFTVKGSLDGQNKDNKFFSFMAGLQNPKGISEPPVVFTKKETTVTIAKPFLETTLTIHDKNDNIISIDPNWYTTGKITFTNNTNSPLRNAQIILELDRTLIVPETIQAHQGFYQSFNNTIVWDASTAESLGQISVGDTDGVSFTFKGSDMTEDKIILNPEALFTVHVKANRNQNNVSDIIENSIIKKVRFNTQVTTTSWSDFNFSTFKNTGPLPPKAESKTSYSAFIEIKNTSNNISGGQVRIKVPNYVEYNGVYAPQKENIVYDAISREIVWNIGDVVAKTGYQDVPSRKIELQVSIIPSVSQVGTTPVLLQNIEFTGTDMHTQNRIQKPIPDISTQIKTTDNNYEGTVSR